MPKLRRLERRRPRPGADAFARMEAELREYHRSRRRLCDIASDIATRGMGVAYDEQSHHQQASPEWSDPTMKRAVALATNKRAAELARTVGAIERTLARLPASHRRLVELFYWRGKSRRRTAEALDISEKTLTRRRHAIIGLIWAEMGEEP